MIDDVDRAWRFVHQEECGGKCRVMDDPLDRGGRTAHGIAANFNPAAWANGPPTVEQARDLFRDLYWEPAGCESLPWPLSLAVVDFAFNSGVARAKRFLTRITVGKDLTKLDQAYATRVALQLIAERRVFLRRLRAFPRFGKGWLARCARLEAMVLE